jgi:phosphatidylinositol alpha 1,6-mannosyltransferase
VARTLRVAHFLGTMRPEHDGMTRVAYRLRSLFNPNLAQHHFLAPIGPQHPQPDIQLVPSIPFPFSTQYRLSTVNASSVRRLLQPTPPDLIHVHTPDFLGAAAFEYARSERIPAIATYHTHFPSYAQYYHAKPLRPILESMLRRIYRDAHAVIVPSQATLEELAGFGLKNLVHIPHGVDTARFSPEHRNQHWRATITNNSNQVIVTFVSRLVWEKNLMVLARAWPLLRDPTRVKLVIVGDGPARARLEQLLPEAKFMGKLVGEALSKAYASSDVFVFPSVTETFGNVTVEAMASGLPAICASVGGARDLVDPEQNGLLFDAHRPVELALAIDRLVSDEGLRMRMSEKALACAGRFRWQETVARYEALYQRLLQSDSERHTRPEALWP